MQPVHLVNEQLRYERRSEGVFQWNEMSHLAKFVHHDHDGVILA